MSEINGSYIDEFTLGGRLVRTYRAPVSYPSDPQLTRNGNIIVADYARPGGVVILSRRTGRVLWSYRPASGPGMLDHPSLAAMLPNGDVIVGDDFNDRIVIIDPHTGRIVWQYGHTAVGGTGPGYLHIPDGFDFVPVTAPASRTRPRSCTAHRKNAPEGVRPLLARPAQPQPSAFGEYGPSISGFAWNEALQPQVEATFGFSKLNPAPMSPS